MSVSKLWLKKGEKPHRQFVPFNRSCISTNHTPAPYRNTWNYEFVCVTSVTTLSAIVTEMKVGARFEEWVQKSCCFLRVNHSCPAAVVLPCPPPQKLSVHEGAAYVYTVKKKVYFFKTCTFFLSNLMFENVLFFMMGGRVWSFEKRVPWVNRQEARTRQSLAPSGFRSWL